MDKNFLNIEAVNYEAQQFLTALRRIQVGTRIIDQSLCTVLMKIVSEIDTFLDSEPERVKLNQEEQLTPSYLRKFNIGKIFVCKKCRLEFGNSLEDVRAHLREKHNLRRKKDLSKNQQAIKYKLRAKVLPKKAKSLLRTDLQSFFERMFESANQLTESPDHKTVENDLLTLIRPAFPDQTIQLHPFGSRISGMGTEESDLDMFIDIGNVFKTFENTSSLETLEKLKVVKNLLVKDSGWTDMRDLSGARVPILRITHKKTETSCDLGFSNSLGVCNTKLIQYLLELQPMVKPMCFFLKKWLQRIKLSDAITTYRINLLVVNYFQHQKVLPSVEILQADLTNGMEIGPWLVSFAKKSLDDLKIEKTCFTIENFKKELKQFFEYYCKFDFENKIVCPYLGYEISPEDLKNSSLLPRYVNYIADDETGKTAFKMSFMQVQDPIQLNHNITKGVAADVVSLLRTYFELSSKFLTEEDDHENNSGE